MVLLSSIGMLLAAAGTQETSHSLNAYGWLVMSGSVSCVLGLIVYCLYRVFTLPPIEQETLKGPLDINTGDTIDAD